MNLLAPISAVGWVTGVFGAEKSFVANPIIGNAKLNEWGLHRARVKTAERMARLRRGMMTGVSDADKAAYNRDGFVIKENYLPETSSNVFAMRCSTSLYPPARCGKGRQ